MSSGKFLSLDSFPTLLNSESFFEKIMEEKGVGIKNLNRLILLLSMLFLYGLVMGAYHSFSQAAVSGVKVAVLFALALLICFPAFFIIQYILGSRLRLSQMISIILSGFVLMAAIMLSFVPIVIIFLLTGSNYYFLHLLHIAIFIFAGLFGMNTIIQALKYSCEKKNIYPRTGVVVFRFWVVILAFVGIQLAWNFRPFLGVRGEPFMLFGQREGNFYAAVLDSARQLILPKKDSARERQSMPLESRPLDTLSLKQFFGDSARGN
jgi:hypothetical protein